MANMTISQQSVKAYRTELLRQEKSQMTVQIYTKNCQEFLRFVKTGLRTESLGKAVVHTWKTSLSTAGFSPATINAKLAAVNGLLRFLGHPECCVRQVRRQRRVFRDKSRDLSKAEYLRLVRTAKDQGRERLCLAMQTICATGIRVSELRFITAGAVRSGRATVTGKGKCREILLPGKLRAQLKAYLKRQGRWPGEVYDCRPRFSGSAASLQESQTAQAGVNAAIAASTVKGWDAPVFLTSGGKPLDRSNLWREMRSLCAAAKVDPHKVFPHNLRHLFAKTFYALDKDLAKLADLLGHASIETTRIYIMETGAAHARMLERMHLLL